MPISKVKTGSITDSAVTSDKINNSAVTSAKIQDGSIVNADINACAAIASSKLTVDTSALESDINKNAFNISLLGFKMAVNEGLTVFNLIDGVVDEFNDESGTDEAEGSNDLYNATDDYYVNSDQPDGQPTCGPISAGFAISSITEPDTSTTQCHASSGTGSPGSFTVCGMSSINAYLWGAGGSGSQSGGGGGGYVEGTFATSPGQTLSITVAEGGRSPAVPGGPEGPSPTGGPSGGFGGIHPSYCGAAGTGEGGGSGNAGKGAGLTYLGTATMGPTPDVVLVAGGGGGGGYNGVPGPGNSRTGGAGGGLTGDAGGGSSEQQSSSGCDGGGGGQSSGGQAGAYARPAQSGGFLFGGDANSGGAGGGAGYYGGGAGHMPNGTVPHGAGGGGSSYYGHPQVTSGSTEEGSVNVGGGVSNPLYVAGTNEGGRGDRPDSPAPTTKRDGEDGYLLITGCQSISALTTSTTIISTAFTSSTVATSARIVVFEENVDTPTLNTDIIASISRDAGVTFTNATLSDSGYVTGSSGQRILTGQADISGQPSGQSMRWKLALANNTVKIHGVSLQWS
jgi:hypothetical protein